MEANIVIGSQHSASTIQHSAGLWLSRRLSAFLRKAGACPPKPKAGACPPKPKAGACPPKPKAKAGFTFIEMVIVLVMLSILLATAVPVYMAQVRATREGVLKNNLAIMRERLDQFRADRNKYPSSLQELIEGGYLRELPEDPTTGTTEWEEVYSDYDPNEPDAEPGIFDVRSRSTDLGTDGRPYSEW